MKDALTFSYCDQWSRFLVWQKAVTLLPIWGIFALPIVGGMFSSIGIFGPVAGKVSQEVGFILCLLVFGAYFVEDLLKTRLRIERGYLWHGFRIYDLSKLSSVGLEYKTEQMLPRKIVLNFSDGKRYKLNISRLKLADTETIVRHFESKYPHAKIDPVLRTLSKCKRVAGTTALETQTKVEIPYQSRLLFRQLYDTFVATADSWMHAGPACVLLFCSTMWLSIFAGLYCSLSILGTSGPWEMSSRATIESMVRECLKPVGETASHTGEQLAAFLANPGMTALLVVMLALITTRLLTYLMRPTAIMLEDKQLSLAWQLGGFSTTLGSFGWSEIARASLQMNSKSRDIDRASLVFHNNTGGTLLKLSLASITPENRIRLLKALERFAPDCAIDDRLAEALMPRQDRSYTELWLQSLSAPPERKSLEPLAPGQLLRGGEFEVIRRLGVGGQGQAYLCKQRNEIGEDVAEVVLKETILPLYVDTSVRQQALERFQQEAELLNKLGSEQIVRLTDYFIEDHRGYLVLEHIAGRTLRQMVEEQGALPEVKVRDIAVQMCEILDYIHGQGVIHRDFTPDNLILKPDGKLTLIDFNVAQTVESGSSGTIVGKHAFVPPEQFRGKPTVQSDIYAMGASLQFLITGADPEPISQSNPNAQATLVSDAMASFVADCTAMQANKRFETAQAARDAALNLYMADDAVVIDIRKPEHQTT